MRVLALVMSLALGLCFSAIGCGGGDTTAPPAPVPDGTIEGNAVNGGPVAGATVMATPTGGGTTYTATTDALGDYTMDVPPGSYDLVAHVITHDDFTAPAPVDVTSSTPTTQNVTFTVLRTYVGHLVCMACHNTAVGGGDDNIHNDWASSGHRFKISKVDTTTPAAPDYPFSTLPDYFGGGGLLDDTTAAQAQSSGPDAPDPDGVLGTTDNPNGTPPSWVDVSYVIGGWGWKARLMDVEGYIVTGTEVQYNYWDGTIFDWNGGGGGMSAYHNNEGAVVPVGDEKPPKFFNCGNCHTTGWRHQDAVLHDLREGGLPGIDGTFAASGIECESCHGAGSAHTGGVPSTANITRIATARTTASLQAANAGFGLPVHCGECHTRDGERDYPTYMSAANTAGWTGSAMFAGGAPIGGRIAASGGFIRHHEQYDEIIGIDPDTMATTRNAGFAGAHGTCRNCHKPHATTHHQGDTVDTAKGRDGVDFVTPSMDGVSMDCQTCHVDSATSVYTLHGHLAAAANKPTHCIDCHMPYLSKSALATYTPPVGSDRPSEGDVSSHIFRINLQRDPADQFTGSGGFAYPEITGQHACQRCHDATDGVSLLPQPMPRAAGSPRIHAP